jgi:[ribosomal protein S5]-alanine N-acetyltransferase
MTSSADEAVVIETRRLILRVFSPDDAVAMQVVHGDPEVMHFSIDGPKTPEQIARFVQNASESHREKGYALWAVVWKDTATMYWRMWDFSTDRRRAERIRD